MLAQKHYDRGALNRNLLEDYLRDTRGSEQEVGQDKIGVKLSDGSHISIWLECDIWYPMTDLKSGCVRNRSDFNVRSKPRLIPVSLTVVKHDIYPPVLDVFQSRPDLFQIISKDKLGLLRLTGRTELLQFLEVRVR